MNKITFRCDENLNKMVEEVMKQKNCDKSTAIRLLLQLILEMGGANLVP